MQLGLQPVRIEFVVMLKSHSSPWFSMPSPQQLQVSFVVGDPPVHVQPERMTLQFNVQIRLEVSFASHASRPTLNESPQISTHFEPLTGLAEQSQP